MHFKAYVREPTTFILEIKVYQSIFLFVINLKDRLMDIFTLVLYIFKYV